MTMPTNAAKVQAWRDAHPGERVTTAILCEVLGLANLSGANLSGANLSEANLYRADLSEANLYRADLYEANLSGANLSEANLSEANLCRADLYEANLSEADHILSLSGLPSGHLTCYWIGTAWQIRIGCWVGSPTDLAALIKSDDWPESRGDEIVRRRPGLKAALAVVKAWIVLEDGDAK